MPLKVERMSNFYDGEEITAIYDRLICLSHKIFVYLARCSNLVRRPSLIKNYAFSFTSTLFPGYSVPL